MVPLGREALEPLLAHRVVMLSLGMACGLALLVTGSSWRSKGALRASPWLVVAACGLAGAAVAGTWSLEAAVAGVLAGIGASAHSWVGHLTPLSVYFFGPVRALLINRVVWLRLVLTWLWFRCEAWRSRPGCLPAGSSIAILRGTAIPNDTTRR